MRQKIFVSMVALAITAVLISSALIFGLMYTRFYKSMQDELRKEALYVQTAIESAGPEYLAQVQNNISVNNLNRITLISAEGTVLFDNYKSATDLENHLDRPEIQAALQQGTGEGTRLSGTMSAQTFYYAILLKDGSILRVANTTDSMIISIINCVPYVLGFVVLVSLAALGLAGWQTRKIIKPINKLDLENPISNETYDELSPLLNRIDKQNHQIRLQIAELESQKTKLTTIIENTSEGLILLNNQANILSINQSAIRLFGGQQTDYTGQHIFALSRNTELQQIISEAEKGFRSEKLISHNDKHYQLISNPVIDNHKVNGTVLLIIDVTEKQAVEQMRREFSANVSHELKTPLQSISGYAEIIKNGLVKEEDTMRFIEKIYSEAQTLILLVNNIMKISRLDEGGSDDFVKEEIDLYSIAKEIIDRLASQAAQKNIKLMLKGEPAIIIGVKQLIEEMMYNLCDNAIKYNVADGEVTVSVSTENDHHILEISDTGIGINEKEQKRIFERFYRIDKSHSKQTGGTGLGLSIVKHSVAYHKARIELTSKENSGTIVRLYFKK
ncbi:PAS domain S-box protein [Selenomonadales bacterium OttesenSCG-928-I06]|nr:PAS domain S-box protein [Selenomonadales bacterium OttesenSCG-928-I06]